MKLRALVLTAGLSTFVGAACSQNPNTANTTVNTNIAVAATPTQTTEAKAVVSGSNLYTTNCMTCHKDSGKGGKVTVEGKEINPDDLTSAKMKAKTDEKLYTYIADGIVDEGMPAFKDKMSKTEIDAVVKHLRDLQNK